MAAPETLKEFVNMQLNLPHTFWTDAASKKLYGDDYETGSQLVSLKKLIPKERNKEQCIQFTADDGDDYVITLSDLQQFWNEQRFEGIHMLLDFGLMCCVVLNLSF